MSARRWNVIRTGDTWAAYPSSRLPRWLQRVRYVSTHAEAIAYADREARR